MKRAAKTPITTTPAEKSFSVGKAFLWFLFPFAIFIAWKIIDAPSGPAQPVNGVVTGSSLTTKNSYINVIRVSDGSVVRQSSGIAAQTGTQVPCRRYARRISHSNYYECSE
jgi:hypothetical protein